MVVLSRHSRHRMPAYNYLILNTPNLCLIANVFVRDSIHQNFCGNASSSDLEGCEIQCNGCNSVLSSCDKRPICHVLF